jgi:N-acetyl-gamma-glutamyl-phosphate reductase
MTVGQLEARFTAAYADEPLVEISSEIPELKDGANHPGLIVGGFEMSEDGRCAVVVAAEDNLLKGAAIQAVQNINLALGLPEFEGLLHSGSR